MNIYKNITHLITPVAFFSNNVIVAIADLRAFTHSPGAQHKYFALFIQSNQELNSLQARMYRRLCKPDDI